MATDTGAEYVYSESDLMQAVATVGPVAVYIEATKAFQSYKKGVFFDGKCSSYNSNHAVLAVGYGHDSKGGDYWLIKNSWGTKWGEKGYVRMARNRNHNCGIGTFGVYPTV